MEMKLYELADAVKRIEELCDSEEELGLYLDQAKMQLQEKAGNIVKFRQYLTTRADAIGIEIKRLSDLQKQSLKRAENLENYISYSMTKNGIDKIETDIATLSFRKSESIEVENAELIPSEYIIIKEVKQVDKIAIKKAIKDGETVNGAILKQNLNLQIR